jgi:hypothetical protein
MRLSLSSTNAYIMSADMVVNTTLALISFAIATSLVWHSPLSAGIERIGAITVRTSTQVTTLSGKCFAYKSILNCFLMLDLFS